MSENKPTNPKPTNIKPVANQIPAAKPIPYTRKSDE